MNKNTLALSVKEPLIVPVTTTTHADVGESAKLAP
ncbi:hypothetical protein M2387_004789 [Klebsiella sp. BIGb0407]|nr:hypothetical protein [Klebsiella sp. BIGb0407]